MKDNDDICFDIIEPDIFKKFIYLHKTDNPKLENKYNELYLKYECFSDNFQYVRVNKPGFVYNKQNDFKKLRERNNNKDFRKTVNGFINKINISNYDIFLAKLRLLLSYDNLKVIITNIINSCIFQDSYIHLLVKLLYDLYNNSGLNSGNRLIKEIINNDYFEFINKKSYKITKNIGELNSLDKFVFMQKHKKEFINKNKYLIEFNNIQKDNLINFSEYFEILWSWFLDEYKNYYLNRDEYYVDMFLNIFIEISKNCKNKTFLQSKKEELSNFIKEDKISFKLKFTIEQLLATLV